MQPEESIRLLMRVLELESQASMALTSLWNGADKRAGGTRTHTYTQETHAHLEKITCLGLCVI